jgi:hypothetical protein
MLALRVAMLNIFSAMLTNELLILFGIVSVAVASLFLFRLNQQSK